ncbi:MAG: hypothetical protein EBQ92_09105 [Proteobacteria bacterium]|nr:hypothetical protein [Pseudomonadota bacterium]
MKKKKKLTKKEKEQLKKKRKLMMEKKLKNVQKTINDIGSDFTIPTNLFYNKTNTILGSISIFTILLILTKVKCFLIALIVHKLWLMIFLPIE